MFLNQEAKLSAQDASLFISSGWASLGFLKQFSLCMFAYTGHRFHIEFALEDEDIREKYTDINTTIYYGDALGAWYMIQTPNGCTYASACDYTSTNHIPFIKIPSNSQRITHLIQYLFDVIQENIFIYKECGKRERAWILSWMYKIQEKNSSICKRNSDFELYWLDVKENEYLDNFLVWSEDEEQDNYFMDPMSTCIYPPSRMHETVGGVRTSNTLRQMFIYQTCYANISNFMNNRHGYDISIYYKDTKNSFRNLVNMSIHAIDTLLPRHYFSKCLTEFSSTLYGYGQEYMNLVYPSVQQNSYISEAFAHTLRDKTRYWSQSISPSECWICNSPVYFQFTLCHACLYEHLHFFFYSSVQATQMPKYAFAPNELFVNQSPCWTIKKELRETSYEKIEDYLNYISNQTCTLFYAIYESMVELLKNLSTPQDSQYRHVSQNTFFRVRKRLRRGLMQTLMRLWYIYCNRFSICSLSISRDALYLQDYKHRHQSLDFFSYIMKISVETLRQEWIRFATCAHDIVQYMYFLNCKGQTLDNICMKEIHSYKHSFRMNVKLDMMFIQMIAVQYNVSILFLLENEDKTILYTWTKESNKICIRYDLKNKRIIPEQVSDVMSTNPTITHNLEKGTRTYDIYENIQSLLVGCDSI
jgi:hypothetical protein